MNAFSALYLPALVGGLTLAELIRSTPLRHKWLFLLGASIPTGLGICSLVLFFSFLIHPLHARELSISIIVGMIVVLMIYAIMTQSKNMLSSLETIICLKKPNLAALKDGPSLFKKILVLASFLLFIYVLSNVIHFFFLAVSTNVTGGWDARYFWSLKAKFMFRSPEDWRLMFSPQLLWSHPDYPLLWPGTFIWGWHWLGHESIIWPPLASLCFYVSCSLLLTWYLAAYVSWITGWLAGAFSLTFTPPLFWAIHQYADVPLTFYITACGLLTLTALRTEDKKILILAGVMAGMASWTKNEGVLFIFAIFLILTGVLFTKHKNQLRKTLEDLSPFALGACIPALATLILKCFLGTRGDYLGSGRTLQNYLATIFSTWESPAIILRAFYEQLTSFSTWKGAWIFFVFALIVLLLKEKKKGTYNGVLILLIITVNLGYVLAILVSPLELKHQIQTALERLIIHSHVLAVAFSFEMLTATTNISFLKNKNGQTAF